MDKSLLTLGSLFDGSGGFPLGGLLCGITPVWASEVEPFPIRVTTKRLPQVQHLGDVRRINGATVPPVDIITFGSPCQSFSIAGKREGMEGKSGLFYEAVRVIREMRNATNGLFPKFAVMENVVGMFSSKMNGKSDFLEVLNELIQIKDPALSVPLPAKGKWSTSGEIVGDGFSLGWRTFDAQFWGVAQRRRRCYIVVHFTGERAGKILFDESGLRGHPPQGGFPWESLAGNSAAGIGSAIAFEPGACSRLSGGVWVDTACTLRADMGDNQLSVAIPINTQAGLRCHKDGDGTGLGVGNNGDPAYTLQAAHTHAVAVENHPQDSRVKLNEDGIVQTLPERMGTGGGSVPMVCEVKTFDVRQTSDGTVNARDHAYETGVSRSLDTGQGLPGTNQGGIAVVSVQGSMIGRTDHNGPNGSGVNMDVSFTLDATDRHGVAYTMTTGGYTQICKESVPTLQARDYKDAPIVARPQYVVRRLTPTECALLQGFPPNWCAGLETPKPTRADIAFWTKVWETHRRILGETSTPKSRKQIVEWLRDPYADACEYKMWGNGVALPNVVFVLGGIVKHG